MIKLRIKGSYLLGALFYMRNINTVYSIHIFGAFTMRGFPVHATIHQCRVFS